MRILVSAFGSAGDLFPLVPLIKRLKADGADVRVATSRTLGLYLRSIGVSSVALGDGSEARVFDDQQLFTRRFDGWSSWRRTLNRYVAPTLAADVRSLEALVGSWSPDVVVATAFAVAARIAAHRHGIRVVNTSIYPQHQTTPVAGSGFARHFTRLALELANPGGPRPVGAHKVLWGSPSDLLLHDPALLGGTELGAAAIGFPYWDNLPAATGDAEIIDGALGGDGPDLVVTMGSFVGLAVRNTWLEAADAVRTLGIRAIFVGARGRWAAETFANRSDITCVGFVPLAPLLPRVQAVLHHGGLGTTFAAIRSACPSVVLPQAFDQSFNARLLDSARLGVDASQLPLHVAVASALAPTTARPLARAAATLIPVETAVETMVNRVHARR